MWENLYSSSSESDSDPIAGLNLKHVTISPVFIRTIQAIPLEIFTPKDLQNGQACSAETTPKHNNLSVLFEAERVI